MKALKDLKDAGVEELRSNIEERRDMIGRMVGQLYPRILQGEMSELAEMIRIKEGGTPKVEEPEPKRIVFIHEGEVRWSNEDEVGFRFFDVDNGECNLSTVAVALKDGTRVQVTIEVL